MQLHVEEAASQYVKAHGGALWVRSSRQRCCYGTTWLRSTTRRPRDAARYAPLPAEGPVTVFFLAAAGCPQRLEIKLRGVVRRRPVALWDGCVFKL
ncbi:MAG: hypothetical protein M0Z40_17050 [Actinomycetota bacterium]|nr:hypothetical protein [Actinomycetota bacterium]